MTTNTKSVLYNFAIIWVLPFENNPKDLDLSYKMDLDLWDCFIWYSALLAMSKLYKANCEHPLPHPFVKSNAFKHLIDIIQYIGKHNTNQIDCGYAARWLFVYII